MRAYAKREGILWAINADCPVPTLKEISSIPIEGPMSSGGKGTKVTVTRDSVKFPVLPLIREEREEE